MATEKKEKENNSVKIIVGVLVAIVLVMIFAVAFTDNDRRNTSIDSEGGLTETEWTLSSVYDTSVPSEVIITANFTEDNKIQGNGGCNSYSGSYTLSQNSIEFSPIASTMMLCPDPMMKFETLYFKALGETTTYGISGSTLTLFDANGKVVAVMIPFEAPSLETSAWEAVGVNNQKGGVQSLILGTTITATFENGSINGSGGCNNYFGSYTVDGDSISFGPIGSTQKFCADPEGLMDQEQNYFAALEKTSTMNVNVDQLTFRDENGSTQVNFLLSE